MNDNSLCSSPQRDRRNQRRATAWSLAWALCFVAVMLGIKKEWLSLGMTLAGVGVTSILGVATLLAYRHFLLETDELRRKIEVDALALAFGVGIVGGMSYWLLAVRGAVPPGDFFYIFLAMFLTHGLGVLFGRRRYS